MNTAIVVVSPVEDLGFPALPMSRAASRYLQHRLGAAEHRAAEQLAREAHCPVQERAFHAAGEYHAAEATTQLTAARKLRLGGTGGAVPPGYHGDSQLPHSSEQRVAGSE
jgi:hypothetical protein